MRNLDAGFDVADVLVKSCMIATDRWFATSAFGMLEGTSFELLGLRVLNGDFVLVSTSFTIVETNVAVIIFVAH